MGSWGVRLTWLDCKIMISLEKVLPLQGQQQLQLFEFGYYFEIHTYLRTT